MVTNYQVQHESLHMHDHGAENNPMSEEGVIILIVSITAGAERLSHLHKSQSSSSDPRNLSYICQALLEAAICTSTYWISTITLGESSYD